MDTGATVRFVCRDLPGNYIAWLENSGFVVHRLEAPGSDSWEPEQSDPRHARWLGLPIQAEIDEFAAAVSSYGDQDWIVVDHFALDARWEHAARRFTRGILAIDGQGDRPHDCDLLLDQNPGADAETRHIHLVPAHCTRLIGAAFALLRPEFAALRQGCRPRTGPIRNILVFFGGTDPTRETKRVVDELLPLLRLKTDGLVLTVVVGGANHEWTRIRDEFGSHPNVRLHHAVGNVAELMADADLAVGAGGVTALERMALMLPCVTIATAHNQEQQVRFLAEVGGVAYLGTSADVQTGQIRQAVEKIIHAGFPDAAGSWTELVDGAGCDRVIAAMHDA
jgi:UDP-2,4-diacetamido-2,4,6-trideoxy-beta-L-altropyranose hydrolase